MRRPYSRSLAASRAPVGAPRKDAGNAQEKTRRGCSCAVSDSISRDVAPDEDGIARSRVLFLCHDDPQPPAVRPTILASWRRSRDFNVAADRIELPYIRDPDIENQLVRSAEPVLRQLGEQLDGQPMSIV